MKSDRAQSSTTPPPDGVPLCRTIYFLITVFDMHTQQMMIAGIGDQNTILMYL